MSNKRLFFRIICVALCMALLSADFFAVATVLPFETQYDYEQSDIAWLTDLVIKEDMTTVEGMAQSVTLVPQPEYPYTETPESFKKEVESFISLYDLTSGSQRAGYIYFFEVLNSSSGFLAADVSDDTVREYLEGMGVEYPEAPDEDELVIARALFVALVTGAYGQDSLTVGADLEEAIVSYLATITGMNMQELQQWLPDESLLSLDNYILAASKLTLWSNGYDVGDDTSEEEIFRLMAVMSVKAQGVAVDEDLSFDELKLRYTAALIGAKYSVVLDSEKLAHHLENDSVPFYLLQLIGKDGDLAIREDNVTYEEAFSLVAENTHYFDVEEDDFYADIYTYSAKLSTRCSSLWVYPTAYATESAYECIVSVNGTPVKNNYYNEIAIDPELVEQKLVIKVTATGGGETSECTYTVHLTQGTYASVEGDAPVTEEEQESFVSSDSLVAEILSGIGVNSIVSDVINNVYSTLPVDVSGVVSFIAPTFGDNVASGLTGTVTDTTIDATIETVPATDDEFFISVLDQIGAIADTTIGGIPGLDIIGDIQSGEFGAVTFE